MSEWEKNLDVTLLNNKEKYFKIAEKRIKAAGFEEMLHIDRTQFTASAKGYVKVYLQAVRREKNFRKWQKAIHTCYQVLQVRVAIGNKLCTAADSRHIIPLCRNADRTADSYGGADCQLISRLRYTHIAVRA